MKKKYTGLWIPKEVFDLRFSHIEEKVLSAIIVLSNGRPCTINNKYFCDHYNIKSKESVSRAIKKFVELGYVRVTYEDMITYSGRELFYITSSLPLDIKSIPLITDQAPLDIKSKPLDIESTNKRIIENKKDNREIETPAPTPEKQLPKHMIATNAFLIFLKENKDVRDMTKKLARYKGGDKGLIEEVTKFCAYYSESGQLMNQIIKNPILATGKLQTWLTRSKEFNKNGNGEPEKYDIYVRDKKPKR